jgi:hypothetical protein
MLTRILSAFVFYTVAHASVTDCSKGTSLFKITALSLTPDPPVKGQNTTLSVSMIVPEVITDGTVTYTTTYNFIPFAPSVESLCGTVPCPIPTGPQTVSSSYPIDASLSGTVTIKIEWKDLIPRQLLCVSMALKV